MTMDALARYYEMAAEAGVRPFERILWRNPRTQQIDLRVLGDPLPLRWRVSRDEWNRLRAWASTEWGWTVDSKGIASTLMGWPIDPDDTLPPRSIVLEPSEDSPAGTPPPD